MNFRLFLSFCFCAFILSPSAQNTPLPNPAKPIPLFADMQFQQGFNLSAIDSSQGRAVEAVLNWGEAKNKPVWRLCQWGTKFSLAKAECEKQNGDRVYRNEAKKVLVGSADSENRDLILEIDGREEYGDRPRRSGEAWPHLLVEQDAAAVHPLSELQELRLKIQLRLLSFQDFLQDQFDAGLHAAQFQLFLIIKNIQPDSKDYNDFFWFGVPFFDNRHDIPPAYMARDAGKNDATGKFIYTIDGKTVNTTPMKQKQWITVDCDLLPHIQEGLKQAAAKGYLHDSDPQHYAAVNMNMGWEIPGTYDASIQVKDFDLTMIRETR